MDDHPIIRASLATAGLNLNANGGSYRPGVAKPLEDKLAVARIYLKLMEEDPTKASIRKLALEAKCSRPFASKIMNEVSGGLVLDPKLKPKLASGGAGSKTFTMQDCFVLLDLRRENNRRSLFDYQCRLFQLTGTLASESVISRWFHTALNFKGSLRAVSQVPIDKYKDANIARAYEYSTIVRQLDPTRVKFTDEKHFKGSEIWNAKGRRCPLTGVVEPVIVDSDFRNTYTIIGFCGIDPETPPFDFVLHTETNNADTFTDAVYQAYGKGFLRTGDFLVMDNAAIHHYKESSVLEYVLMEKCGVVVIFLPTRSPELNPIELLWNTLVKRLRKEALNFDSAHFRSHRAAYVAQSVMEKFTHEDVMKVYKKRNYIN